MDCYMSVLCKTCFKDMRHDFTNIYFSSVVFVEDVALSVLGRTLEAVSSDCEVSFNTLDGIADSEICSSLT